MKLQFAQPTETKSTHERREEQWHHDYRRTKAMSSIVDTLAQHSVYKRAAAELGVGSFQREQDANAIREEEESGSGDESDGEGEDGNSAGTGQSAADAISMSKKTTAHTTAHKISAFRQFSAREHAAVCTYLPFSPLQHTAFLW